jgi:hypothetical protein
MNTTSRLRAVLIGGSIAGALDILFAITYAAVNGTAPVKLLQTVASGLLGMAAFDGGVPAAILGLAAHFGLSYLWAALFVAAASRLPQLVAKPAVAGVTFGVLVFFTMRLIVLPLSAFPYPIVFRPLSWGLDLLSHMFFFGMPIALMAAKAIRSGRQP